jgi:hypothetical protein
MLTEKDEAFIREIIPAEQVSEAVIRAAQVVVVWAAAAGGGALDARAVETAISDALWLQASNGYFTAFGVMMRAMMQQVAVQARALRGTGVTFDAAAIFLGAIVPAVAATLDSQGPGRVAEVAAKTQAYLASR